MAKQVSLHIIEKKNWNFWLTRDWMISFRLNNIDKSSKSSNILITSHVVVVCRLFFFVYIHFTNINNRNKSKTKYLAAAEIYFLPFIRLSLFFYPLCHSTTSQHSLFMLLLCYSRPSRSFMNVKLQQGAQSEPPQLTIQPSFSPVPNKNYWEQKKLLETWHTEWQAQNVCLESTRENFGLVKKNG